MRGGEEVWRRKYRGMGGEEKRERKKERYTWRKKKKYKDQLNAIYSTIGVSSPISFSYGQLIRSSRHSAICQARTTASNQIWNLRYEKQTRSSAALGDSISFLSLGKPCKSEFDIRTSKPVTMETARINKWMKRTNLVAPYQRTV